MLDGEELDEVNEDIWSEDGEDEDDNAEFEEIFEIPEVADDNAESVGDLLDDTSDIEGNDVSALEAASAGGGVGGGGGAWRVTCNDDEEDTVGDNDGNDDDVVGEVNDGPMEEDDDGEPDSFECRTLLFANGRRCCDILLSFGCSGTVGKAGKSSWRIGKSSDGCTRRLVCIRRCWCRNCCWL